MEEAHSQIPLMIFLVGAALVLAEIVKTGLARVGIPVPIGYMAIGFGLRAAGTTIGSPFLMRAMLRRWPLAIHEPA